MKTEKWLWISAISIFCSAMVVLIEVLLIKYVAGDWDWILGVSFVGIGISLIAAITYGVSGRWVAE